MNTAWQITAGVQRVELKDGQAEVVFTVSNPGPVDDRATVDVVGSEQTDASWFTVAEPQRVVPHGGSVTFPAVLRPPAGAPAGSHWLAGRVYSADSAPEETAVTSNRVVFEIAASEEKPKSKLWLWILIGAAIVAVVVGVILFLVLGGDDEPTVLGSKEIVVSQGAGIDIDTLQLASTEENSTVDFSYGLIEGGTAELLPINAVFPDVTPSGSEAEFAADCKTASGTRSVVQFGPGERGTFCVRSNDGRVGVLTVTEPTDVASGHLDIGLKVTTYEFPE